MATKRIRHLTRNNAARKTYWRLSRSKLEMKINEPKQEKFGVRIGRKVRYG